MKFTIVIELTEDEIERLKQRSDSYTERTNVEEFCNMGLIEYNSEYDYAALSPIGKQIVEMYNKKEYQ